MSWADVSCWARGFRLEEEDVSWAICRGPVALRPSLPADSIVDVAAPRRPAGRRGRRAAARPSGPSEAPDAGRDAAASRRFEGGDLVRRRPGRRAAVPGSAAIHHGCSRVPGAATLKGNNSSPNGEVPWRSRSHSCSRGDVWRYANRYFAALRPEMRTGAISPHWPGSS